MRTFVCSVSVEDAPSSRSLQRWVVMLQNAKSLLLMLESISPPSQRARRAGTITRFLGSVVSGTSDSLDGTAVLARQAATGPGANCGWNVRSCLPDLRL